MESDRCLWEQRNRPIGLYGTKMEAKFMKRVRLSLLIAARIFKIFLLLYRIRKFITVFTKVGTAHPQSLNSVYNFRNSFHKKRFSIIPPSAPTSHKSLSSLAFLNFKFEYTFSSSPSTLRVPPLGTSLIGLTLTVVGGDYEVWSSSLSNSLHPLQLHLS